MTRSPSAPYGQKPDFGFEPKDHLELAGPDGLGLIDIEAAAKVSGSRFHYLLGDLVRLELAMVQWGMDKLTGKGFLPVVPPVLVREPAMEGTGMFPEAREQAYAVEQDDLFLVGTAEVPLASLHAGAILEEAQLPLRYVGFSPCFRREAGAAGKDTRGIFRVHQFDKLEMFVFCLPDQSQETHDQLLAIEEEIAQELGFHYQVQNIPMGDLGAAAAKKYDIEVWLPGQQRYRELTSCSNTTDFQSRRLDIRYRPASGGPRHVHTLNGTALTSSRTLLALIEYGQQADGSVRTPGAAAGVRRPGRARSREPSSLRACTASRSWSAPPASPMPGWRRCCSARSPSTTSRPPRADRPTAAPPCRWRRRPRGCWASSRTHARSSVPAA